MYFVDEHVEVYILCDNRWVDAVIVGQPGDYEGFPRDYGVDVVETHPQPGFFRMPVLPGGSARSVLRRTR